MSHFEILGHSGTLFQPVPPSKPMAMRVYGEVEQNKPYLFQFVPVVRREWNTRNVPFHSGNETQCWRGFEGRNGVEHSGTLFQYGGG